MDAYDADDMEYMDDDDEGEGDDGDGDEESDEEKDNKKDPKKWTKVDLENQYYKSKGTFPHQPNEHSLALQIVALPQKRGRVCNDSAKWQ